MRIVEFRVDHPILREALLRVPELDLQWVQSDIRDDGDGRLRLLVWASGDDYAAFDAALEDDPSVATVRRTVDVGGRRLYQLDVVAPDSTASLYPVIVDEGAVIRSIRGSAGGWEFRLAFPSDAAVTRFFDFCGDHDVPFTIHRTFEETNDRPHGLTEVQNRTLQKALEAGYFDVPRRASLIDIADDLGLSDTAVSQRLRRGLRTLVTGHFEPTDRDGERRVLGSVGRDR